MVWIPAFVLGVFRPRIYLPVGLREEEQRCILLHERTHLKRLDHLTRLAAFAALCLHWFNPLVWVAFYLSGRDMEMSCDEAVIKALGTSSKKTYSSSLLTLAVGRRFIPGAPLAFWRRGYQRPGQKCSRLPQTRFLADTAGGSGYRGGRCGTDDRSRRKDTFL